MILPQKLYFYDIQMVLVLVLLLVCLSRYLFFLWKQRHLFIKSWNVPGPFNFPIIGSTYHFMSRPEYIFEKMVNLQETYPGGLKMWFGNNLWYFLHKPEHIEKVLKSNKLVQKQDMYKHIIEAIGEGLITAPPEKWKKHRKIILPSFNQKILDSFVEVFAEQSLVLTEVLTETCGTSPDIFGIFSRCTLDIVCETAMGLQLNIQRTNGEYGDIFDKIMLLVFVKVFQIWNHVDFLWKLLGHDRKMKAYLKMFTNLTDLVIKQKMEAMESQTLSEFSTAYIEEVPRKRLAFLDYIMESGRFDAKELREEISIFLFAGTDTTASTLSFLFAILGMFPDVQEKVLQEVIQVMGNYRVPECKDLPHMVYTERVIKETLRLFPVGCLFMRAITEDVDLGDSVIPKGASAFFGLVFIHRNPKYWSDPLKFDPDRFLPEEVAKRHPCTYIPFSFGPRNCIGLNYGMMSLKVIIATVIRKLKIHCEYKKIEDIKLKANIVLRFQDGAKVSLTPRK